MKLEDDKEYELAKGFVEWLDRFEGEGLRVPPEIVEFALMIATHVDDYKRDPTTFWREPV